MDSNKCDCIGWQQGHHVGAGLSNEEMNENTVKLPGGTTFILLYQNLNAKT